MIRVANDSKYYLLSPVTLMNRIIYWVTTYMGSKFYRDVVATGTNSFF